jgi:hypothetical protein
MGAEALRSSAAERAKPVRRERHEVSQRGDPVEREAEAMAERALEGGTCAACASGGSCGRPKCGHRTVPESTVPAGDGASIPDALRGTLERGFGRALDDITLHTGPGAHEHARGLAAEAYTVGSHVVLGGNAPALDSTEGKKLVAHEVAHVLQGTSGPAIRRRAADAPTQLLVEAHTDPGPGQMRVTDFFAAVRPAVTRSTNAVLARVGRTSDDCPYLGTWLAYYEAMPAAHVERAAMHYAGAAATSAHVLIGAIVGRATSAAERWVETGEMTGLPVSTDSEASPLAALRKAEGSTAGPRDATDAVSRLGPGVALDGPARAPMERALGRSLGDVRIHADARGAAAASALDARAFTVGRQIAFAPGEYRPGTLQGDLLLAHELAHVAQQGGVAARGEIADQPALEHEADVAAAAVALGGRASVRTGGLKLQRCKKKAPKPITCTKPAVTVATGGASVNPTDVAGELVCEPFELRADRSYGGVEYKAKTKVWPLSWDNNSSTVNVMLADGTGITFDVEKSNLRPATAGSPNVAAYDVGLDDQADTVEKRRKALADWDAKEKTATDHNAWQKTHDDLADKLKKSEVSLNKFEIKQFMYNRQDDAIEKAVAAANARYPIGKTDPLDPNYVKSQLFQETELGTAGKYLADDSSQGNDVVNHFNIAQAIDSSGEMYANYFVKEDTARAKKFKLEHIVTDMYKAKEAAQKAKTKFSGEDYFWSYPGFVDACNDLWNSSGGTPKNKTYGFWIEMSIFWLFQKRASSTDWPEAIRKYNGAGPEAEKYKKDIVARAKAAIAAKAAGTKYSPAH